jgi:hypothetical protein
MTDAIADLLGASAIARPYLRDGDHQKAMASILHFFPDLAERRKLAVEVAGELYHQSLQQAVPEGFGSFDGYVDHLLGLEEVICAAYGISRRRRRAAMDASLAFKNFGADIQRGRGPYLQQFNQNHSYVAHVTAGMIVILGRL